MTVPGEATDEALVLRAALGDNDAFDEIAIRYQARVYRLACRLVGCDDAPDVVQEGFLSVYRTSPRSGTSRGSARGSSAS
jgi:DNA-directed RNA polymerase specialized sigma24 family protein